MKWTKAFNESRYGFDISDENGKHIAFVQETTGDPEAEKNARMIESAPEMFDLLTRANEADADGDDPPPHFWARVRKLLRSIEGEKKAPSSEPPSPTPGPSVKISPVGREIEGGHRGEEGDRR